MSGVKFSILRLKKNRNMRIRRIMAGPLVQISPPVRVVDTNMGVE